MFDTEAAAGDKKAQAGSRVLGGASSVGLQGTAFSRTLQVRPLWMCQGTTKSRE